MMMMMRLKEDGMGDWKMCRSQASRLCQPSALACPLKHRAWSCVLQRLGTSGEGDRKQRENAPQENFCCFSACARAWLDI